MIIIKDFDINIGSKNNQWEVFSNISQKTSFVVISEEISSKYRYEIPNHHNGIPSVFAEYINAFPKIDTTCIQRYPFIVVERFIVQPTTHFLFDLSLNIRFNTVSRTLHPVDLIILYTTSFKNQ
jgi:hypothetical protein